MFAGMMGNSFSFAVVGGEWFSFEFLASGNSVAISGPV